MFQILKFKVKTKSSTTAKVRCDMKNFPLEVLTPFILISPLIVDGIRGWGGEEEEDFCSLPQFIWHDGMIEAPSCHLVIVWCIAFSFGVFLVCCCICRCRNSSSKEHAVYNRRRRKVEVLENRAENVR